MADIPLTVLMRGPEAVAEHLAKRDADAKARYAEFQAAYLAMLKAAGISMETVHEVDERTYSTATAAAAQIAVMLMYTAKKGMRGPARDALSEIIDVCFDLVDSVEEGSPQMAEMMEKIRNG